MDIAHDSDCAVHNGPAMEPGPCNCGAQAKHERRWFAFLYLRGCTQLARLRTRLGTWSVARFCEARTSASRALYLSCYRLLFGTRATRDSLPWLCRARKARQSSADRRK